MEWFFNCDAASAGGAEWAPYSAADSARLEAAYSKKQKSLKLSDTYAVEFSSMRQVRRDDATRWRAIKRGGRADDPPPVAPTASDADADAEAEAEPDADADAASVASKPKAKRGAKTAAAKAKAPAAKARGAKKGLAAEADDVEDAAPPAAAATPAPAAAPAAAAPAKRGRAAKKAGTPPADEEDAPAPVAAAAAAGGDSAVAAPAASSARVAELQAALSAARSEVAGLQASLKAQVGDLDAELAAMQRERDAAAAQVAALQAKLATEKKAAEAATAMATAAAAEVAALQKSAAAAEKNAAAKLQTEIERVKAESASGVKAQVDAAKAAAAAAASAQQSELRSQVESLTSQYGAVMEALRPIRMAFGLDATTPLGKALKQYESQQQQQQQQQQQTHGQPAAAAAKAAPASKRARPAEPSDEDDEEPASPPPQEKKARHASPPRSAAPHAAASRLAPPAATIDDDATQPMAPPADDEAATDEAMSDAAASPSPLPAAAGWTPAMTSLANPAQLKSTLLPLAANSQPQTCAFLLGAGTPLALLGCRDGTLGLFELPSDSAPLAVPLQLLAHPAHPYRAAFEEGDYSACCAVQCLAAHALPGGRKWLVFSGEGRLLRCYLVARAAGAGASCTFLQQLTLPAGAFYSCLTLLRDPSRDDVVSLAAGVSGGTHCVQVYQAPAPPASFDAPQSLRLALLQTYPTRSDEVRAIQQLSDGRLAVAGCSVLLAGRSQEGGAIELFLFGSGARERGSSTLLKHDALVDPAVGLRCNDLVMFQRDGADQLVAAFEHCQTGERQLCQFVFGREALGADQRVIQLEAKHTPPVNENTYVSLALSGDGAKLAALTFGGRMLCFDLVRGAKLGTVQAHAESAVDDVTHVHIDRVHGLTITTGGADMGANVVAKLWRAGATR